MKVFVTGVGGQLGYDVMNELNKCGIEAVGSDILSECDKYKQYIPMDITDLTQVESVLNNVKPDAVIHCAAWTAVDAAEDEENKPKVYKINADGTENIARVCKALDCKIMYISTDYVFDGQGTEPWQPDCKSYAPLNVYGDSKLKGELAVSSILDKYFIVRIAWVFGVNGKNFIKTMLNVGKKHDTVRVVYDQIGTPTYTYDLVRLLVDMIVTDKYGYYHATNEGGYISWYDFTKEIYMKPRYNKVINVIASTTFGVLLIHANSDAMRQWLWKDLLNVPSLYTQSLGMLVLYAIIIPVAVFVVCSLIDLIRIYALEKPFFKLLDKHKDGINRFTTKVKNACVKLFVKCKNLLLKLT